MTLPPLAAALRAADPDRWLTSLFAPAEQRAALWVLYLFNHELARAREVASNPMLALIRLQWWREVAEGARRRHEIATPLSDLLDAGRLSRDDVLAMIDGREAEAEEAIATTAAFRAYLEATAGGLAVAAGRLLGGAPADLAALRAIGAAYGAAGVLRSTGRLARAGRVLLPADALAARGLGVHDVLAGVRPGAVLRDLAGLARTWLPEGRLSRAALPAGLVGALARRDLARPGEGRPRGLGDRLAVVAAALRGGL